LNAHQPEYHYDVAANLHPKRAGGIVPNAARRTLAAILFILLLAPIFHAASPPEPRSAKAAEDYSPEPVVLESEVTKLAFENDGTSNNENVGRVRIQSQAGIQAFGILHVPYPSANASVEFVSVKVTKPDGRVVVTPAGNMMDMPAAVTQTAPLYSDLHDKQVPVKGMEIGDVLEYDIKVHFQTPLIPGQFWYAYNFNRANIVLAEELEIKVPKDRAVKVASANLQPVITEDAGRKTYTWKTSNLDRKASDAAALARSPLHIPPPSVQITTFRNWDEIAQWYRGLEDPAAEPSAEIRSLAEKLTQGAVAPADKTRILYNYVATKIRYVGLDFGIGRYQPHAAADILENGYGDCKDKHTLLAAMLSSIGIKAYPALVNSAREIDPDLPSPSEFDHVVTVVPQGNGATWLDTTAEVLPFGFVTLNLRDHNSLVISDDGPVKLVKAPADSPVPTFMDFQIIGKLDAAGTLTAKIEVQFRGDFEVAFREAFRSIPQSRWKDGVQGMSGQWGFGGTVDDVTVSSPEKTDEPFHISYTYLRKEFSDWPNKRITAPFPSILAYVRDEKELAAVPVELGPPGKFTFHAEIELPDGLAPVIPVPDKVSYKKDYADYGAEYSVTGNTLKVERHAVTSVQEVPANRRAEYITFRKSVEDDESRYIAAVDFKAMQGQFAKNPEAAKLYEQAVGALQLRDAQRAMDLSRRAIAAEPEFPGPYMILASVFMMTGRTDEALEPLRKIEKLSPNDPIAPREIGRILLAKKQAREAIPDLEAAVKNFPENPAIAMELGQAYIRTGEKEKAVPILKKTAQLDASPLTLNNVAYELAEAGIALDDALSYSEKAVDQIEEQSSKMNLDDMKPEDWRIPQTLRSYWDTLGWIHFRLNHFEQAEKYLRAAWPLDSSGLIGDHLGQAYEKDGKKQEAIHIYSLVAGSDNPGIDHALGRVQKLMGNDLKGDDAVIAARDEYRRINRVRIPRTSKGGSSAEFMVIFKNGSAEHDVRFFNGSEELREALSGIKNAKFDIRFPDDHPATMVLSGFLSCAPTGPTCDFLLIKPQAPRAAN
jgi:tetratricopeptide (TPR) repeat protein